MNIKIFLCVLFTAHIGPACIVTNDQKREFTLETIKICQNVPQLMATVPLQYERIVQESLGSRLSSSLKAHRTLEFTTSVKLNMAGSVSSGISLQNTNNEIGTERNGMNFSVQ